MIGGAGRVSLTDFGLARQMGEERSGATTKPGRIMGTPDYMAPEQLLGKPAGPATDLFAFGVLLYRMLTDEKPWPENDRWNAEPIPLRRRRPEAPKRWEEAIQCCLRRDPAERPQTVEELGGLLDVMPLGASSAERAALRPRPKATRWRWAAAIFFAVLALVGWMFRDPWQGPQTQSTGDGWQIALLPFEAIGGAEALAGSAAGLGDVIARRLSQFDGPSGALMVASPREVRGRGIESPSEARDQLGARMVVEGSLSGNGDEVQLTLGIVDPQTSSTVSSATVTDARANLMGLERKAVARLSNMLSLRLKPDNAEAPLDLAPGAYELYVRGLSYLERDDRLEQVEYAEGLFRKAVEADPDFADAQAGLAGALWQKFKRTSNPDWIAAAVKEAEKALALDPHSRQAHITLGLAKNRRPERQKEALAHFNRVLAGDPNDGEALEGLADAYKRMGRKEEAEAAYRDMLNRRRGDWRAYKQIALFYEGQGRYDEAIALLREALELTPDNAEIPGTLGTLFMLKGDLATAKVNYEKSIRIEPSIASLTNLGGIYTQEGDLPTAIDLLERAVQIPSARYSVWNALARAYDKVGRESDKRKAASRAAALAAELVRSEPENPTALLGVASAKVLLGLRDEALKEVELALAVQPGSPRILGAAAAIVAEAQDYESARRIACKAVAQGIPQPVLESSESVQEAFRRVGECR